MSSITPPTPDANAVAMIAVCQSGDIDQVRKLLLSDKSCSSSMIAAKQDDSTGKSPLMAAAQFGHLEICRILLDHGAPWNAVDRHGQCAGNYATDEGHQDVIDMLVDAGVKAELILGAAARLSAAASSDAISSKKEEASEQAESITSDRGKVVEHEPCIKPDYLSRDVRYEGDVLLDEDDDAVMMEWERPLMDLHASVITSSSKGKRVMNVGFGMGIIDSALQELDPSLHIIIEAHPTVHAKMLADGWDKKDNVRICFGKWQDELPKLIQEGVTLDGIFFDTYAEHFMEEFHEMVANVISKPHGIYSYFNGLAPDNIFFHGVACQCVKLQLAQLGLDTEFAPCEIKVKESSWEGVRRKYWHGDTYYLPICTWNQDFLKKTDVCQVENASTVKSDQRESKKLRAGSNPCESSEQCK